MPNALNKKPKQFEAFDEWLLIKLNKLVELCTASFENYESSRPKQEINNFFWHVFCDNYLEIIKSRVYNNKKGKEAAQYTLYYSFFNILKLLAPIMPYITEELYQVYFKKSEKVKSIHITEWPESDKKMINENIEKAGDRAIEIIKEVRTFKSKAQKSMKAPIILTIEKKDQEMLKDFMEDLKAVTAAKEIKEGKFEIKLIE